MSDYISREVARERLRKTCKAGSIVSVLILLLGLFHAALVAIVFLGVQLPEVVANVQDNLVAMDETYAGLANIGVRAVLFFLVGLVGTLMFGKMSKTGDAFRAGQMRQFKFIAVLLTLLGFLPSLVANGVNVFFAFQEGRDLFENFHLEASKLCILAGIFMFVVARVLVAGAVLGKQEEDLAGVPGINPTDPSYAGVPDLGNVSTAQETTAMPADAWHDASDFTTPEI